MPQKKKNPPKKHTQMEDYLAACVVSKEIKVLPFREITIDTTTTFLIQYNVQAYNPADAVQCTRFQFQAIKGPLNKSTAGSLLEQTMKLHHGGHLNFPDFIQRMAACW